MKISVSTIWLSTPAIAPRAATQRPMPDLQSREDQDVEGLRGAVGEDSRGHQPPALPQHDRESGLGRLIHPFVGRQLDDQPGQDDRGDQRHEAESDQPVGDRAAVQLGDDARQRDQQQEREDAGLDRERPERHLL